MAERQVEVFSAGCPVCEPVVQLVNELACPDCEVTVLDLRDADAAAKASAYGVKTVPAVAVNGQLVSCCDNPGPDRESLLSGGIGRPI